MGKLAERLNGIRVRASAPGVDIRAELRHRTEFSLTFGKGVYAFIDEAVLERALADLARLLHAGWQRQYQKALSPTSLIVDSVDQRDKDFMAERRAIESSGVSRDGRVALSTIGMQEFDAQVQRGTVHELSEDEFVARVTAAGGMLLDDYLRKVDELKLRYYG